MMEKMGTLMEQGNFLLAQSQGATINPVEGESSKPDLPVVVDVAPTEVTPAKKASKTKKKTGSKKTKGKTKKQSKVKVAEPPKKRRWWNLLVGK